MIATPVFSGTLLIRQAIGSTEANLTTTTTTTVTAATTETAEKEPEENLKDSQQATYYKLEEDDNSGSTILKVRSISSFICFLNAAASCLFVFSFAILKIRVFAAFRYLFRSLCRFPFSNIRVFAAA